jgi:succinyl-diaminopimelate desuccinylase
VQESALTPLLARAPLDAELVVMMEPTACELHLGCLGNVNATWTFHGRSGHSARPWTADNAIERAAAGVLALAAQPPQPHRYDGLEFVEVASVTRIAGGIARNVIPDRAECHVNFRYAPGRAPDAAEARLAELCGGHGELRIDANAPSGPVATGPRVDALVAAGDLARAPKQAWTPVAELGQAGLPAVNFGPGDPAQAHRRDESVAIAALERAYAVLERFAA